jgi:hypothetical protein
MKLSERIVAFIRDNGPEFGPDLCKALDMDVCALGNHTRTALENGSLVVEKRIYPGTNRKLNYFSLPEEKPLLPIASAGAAFNPADPFGLVARRQASAAPEGTDPVQDPEAPVRVVPNPVEQPAPPPAAAEQPTEDWRHRALVAEERLAKVRALLNAIGIVATQDAALICTP